jgi:hypothetical protein
MTTQILERPSTTVARPTGPTPVRHRGRRWALGAAAAATVIAAAVVPAVVLTGGGTNAPPSAAAFRVADSYSWTLWEHVTPTMPPTPGSPAAFRIADVTSTIPAPPVMP